jgi:hypothetical protein
MSKETFFFPCKVQGRNVIHSHPRGQHTFKICGLGDGGGGSGLFGTLKLLSASGVKILLSGCWKLYPPDVIFNWM